MIVHNFETTVTVPQHTVVVPKPACSYQNYTTFQRCFQVFSWFFVLALFYTFYFFLRAYNFNVVSCTPRSVRDPGLPPGAFALPRCAPQGGGNERWVIVWFVYWWTELSDGLLLIFEGYFWSGWSCFVKWLKLFWCADGFDCFLSVMFIAVYLLSTYFACALPYPSFTIISPEVILRDEVRNVYICSIWNNYSVIKPRGWDFVTTPTRFEV